MRFCDIFTLLIMTQESWAGNCRSNCNTDKETVKVHSSTVNKVIQHERWVKVLPNILPKIPTTDMHRTDKYSKHSSIIWSVWLNGWVFVYERSGCGFESRCSHSKFLSENKSWTQSMNYPIQNFIFLISLSSLVCSVLDLVFGCFVIRVILKSKQSSWTFLNSTSK